MEGRAEKDQEEMNKAELIFVPLHGIGHLVSALELAKRLLDHDDRLSITILVMKPPFTPFVDSYVKPVTDSQPRIQLVNLPQVEPPPMELLKKSPEAWICNFVESHIPHVRNIVTNIVTSVSSSGSSQVAGLVLDFFCVSMIDIANELGLPSYVFVTSNAGFLGLMLYLSDRHDQFSTEFESSDPGHLIPGFVNPVPPSVLPEAVFNKQGGYAAYIKVAQRFKDAKGIIVNTFAELEPYSIKSFLNDQTPPVYTVGPLLNLKGQPHPELDHVQRERIMKWLDKQPQSSVVFLCFGSMGSFNASQMKEIALGLEQSGFKFLWSMRVPAFSHFSNPEEMLPEGFLERIRGRGVVCGWVPQVEVLVHKAIGGFVSHCGWNSILESLWHGVPIVTFPIYAEQQLNAFMMVRELELAVELRLDYRADGNLVMADEIARALQCVMQSDSEVRKKVEEIGEIARKAVTEGGSSFTCISQLVNDIISGS